MIDYKKLARLIDTDYGLRLISKYEGIAALPLALPKIEPDSWKDFWTIWNSEKEKVKRQHIDRGAAGAPNPGFDYTQWDGVSIYEDPELYSIGAWATKISQPMIDANPKMLSAIFDQLPFVKIRSVRFWSSTVFITPHRDDNMPNSLNALLRYPTEIRIMIDDKNPKETFWLADRLKFKPRDNIDLANRHYVRLPADSNTFAWNNEDYLHGADYDPQYQKILAVVKGWVDVRRLESLIDQSIDRYPEFVVRI